MWKGVREAQAVFSSVCKVFGLTGKELRSRECSQRLYLAWGVCCFICCDDGIHPSFSCKLIRRSRSNVINIARHYKGYYDTGGKEVVMYHDKVIADLCHTWKRRICHFALILTALNRFGVTLPQTAKERLKTKI